MDDLKLATILSKETIREELIRILEDITGDWEMGFNGKIEPETRLVEDLTFASIDVVQLAVAIEEHFKRRNLPFQKLVMTPDGRYVDDVRVSELVDFLHTWINR